MIKKLTFALFFLIALIYPNLALAVSNPVAIPNNKFGIHIIDENDLVKANELVNSNGGDWGYVTMVITQDQRDRGRWQNTFNEMRRMHLIPIIRVATKLDDKGNWQIPEIDDIDNWVNFFNSLNWVIKNRYIIISNEPNHAKEWGGKIDPEGYATYLGEFSKRLKNASGEYFPLPAGFDTSANNSKSTMSFEKYINQMIKDVPEAFNYVDGWTSHSYPNPEFAGSEYETGKGTITSYDWELGYLRDLGINRELPVFITETGWSNKNVSSEEIAKKMKYAFTRVWKDKKVVAVTPFLLNYHDDPFEEFSWNNKDGTPRPVYQSIKDLTKTKGQPEQVVKGKIIGVFVNPFVVAGNSVGGVVLTQNLGQSIWISPEIQVIEADQKLRLKTEDFKSLEPNEIRLIRFKSNALFDAQNYDLKLNLTYKDKLIADDKDLELLVLAPSEVKKTGIFARILGYFKSLINQLPMKFMGP